MDMIESMGKLKRTLAEAKGPKIEAQIRNETAKIETLQELVVIGMNPVTKLWEFYHLRSAWDGKSAPNSIAIPSYESDGKIAVKDGTGIVFVLLPGGKFLYGAQQHDETKPNYDSGTKTTLMVSQQEVAPFLIARHELTKGQWKRLWSGDDRMRQPSYWTVGQNLGNQRITLAHPVENASWIQANMLMRQTGLTLATGLQWEYSCRAGTTTTWAVDPADMAKHANLADQSAKKGETNWSQYENWTDGHVLIAPVGYFSANAFGLHDMYGNVGELCLQSVASGFDFRGTERKGPFVFSRGGTYANLSRRASSATTTFRPPRGNHPTTGFRPTRVLKLRR